MIDSISEIDEIYDSDRQDEIDLILLDSVRLLAKSCEFYKAYGLAKLIAGGNESAESLNVIAERMIEAETRHDAILILQKAGVLSSQDTEVWQQAELLNRIAKSYLRLERLSDASYYFNLAIDAAKTGQLTECQQDRVDSSSVLSEIALSIASMGDVNWALEVAEEIIFAGRKENTRLEIEFLQKKQSNSM